MNSRQKRDDDSLERLETSSSNSDASSEQIEQDPSSHEAGSNIQTAVSVTIPLTANTGQITPRIVDIRRAVGVIAPPPGFEQVMSMAYPGPDGGPIQYSVGTDAQITCERLGEALDALDRAFVRGNTAKLVIPRIPTSPRESARFVDALTQRARQRSEGQTAGGELLSLTIPGGSGEITPSPQDSRTPQWKSEDDDWRVMQDIWANSETGKETEKEKEKVDEEEKTSSFL
ncbi:hypothetical protein MMC25_004878 [Agyrium rufum]|nr:hypothetical protein [Agyrium rufum]